MQLGFSVLFTALCAMGVWIAMGGGEPGMNWAIVAAMGLLALIAAGRA